jgi:hypothetical protein
LLEKHVISMWKVVADLLEVHPLSFVPFLQGGLEFAAFFGFSEEGRSIVFERVAIHALNLVKAIILCIEFRAPRPAEGISFFHQFNIIRFSLSFEWKLKPPNYFSGRR